MMTKKNILIIENSKSVTGAFHSILNTTNFLSSEFNFIYLVPSKSTIITQLSNYKVEVLPMLEISKRVWAIFAYVPILIFNAILLRKILNKYKITLIHSNDVYNLLPFMYKVLGGKVNYICHVRFMLDRFWPALVNAWVGSHLKFAKKIIAVSESVKAQLPESDKILRIYEGLPISARGSAYDINVKVLLYISNYIDGKGHEFAIRAFSKVSKEFPEWTLRLVGDDMNLHKNKLYKSRLIRLVSELQISNKVEFIGFQEHVEKEYLNSSIALNFSESESFSRVCLEAVYFKCPIIATRCGGPSEIVKHGVNGLLVDNRDLEQMTKAMVELMSDPLKRKLMSDKSGIDMTSQFWVNNTINEMRMVYLCQD